MKLKIALAHDFLNQWGGGERVCQIFQSWFPGSSVKTIAYDPSKVSEFDKVKVETSIIQHLPFARTHYKWYLVLMPWAVSRFKFTGYNLVLSDCSGFIKNIRLPKSVLHICYMHTPTRYLTSEQEYFKQTVPSFLHWLMPPFLHYLQQQDLKGAQQPQVIIANSQEVAKRIEQYYHRKPTAVVFPPVDTSHFYHLETDQVGDYYLIAGRLVPYKRFDLAIEACNQLGKRLMVIGSGPEEAALRAQAGPTIQFLGRVSNSKLREAYAGCKAMLFPPLEDAGMTPIECMACGRPVIAYGVAGALETVVPNQTGLFFQEQTVQAIVQAIEQFEQLEAKGTFKPAVMVKHAKQFGTERFKCEIMEIIQQQFEQHYQQKLELNVKEDYGDSTRKAARVLAGRR